MTQPKTASKFTPGPWTDRGQHPYLVAMVHHVSVMLDTPDSGGGPEYSVSTAEQSGANARLIAKAPEMYELLEVIINYFEPLESIPRELSVRQSKWLNEARRIKAEIDGEG